MDPLSDTLALLRARRLKTGAADVAGSMSIAVPAHEGLFCYAVIRGSCWLTLDDLEPLNLAAGDCVVLASGRAFRLASDLDATPVDAATLFAAKGNGGLATFNGGGDCLLYAAHFAFDRQPAGMILGLLPPVVRIREEDDHATLRWSLDRMMAELRGSRPGGDLIAGHLAHLVLVEALRLHLVEAGTDRTGWLFALADERVAAAISALHAAPARGWSVGAMAGTAGMSRTAFAVRFKACVGLPPIEYLTRWRMLLAAEALRRPDQTVSTVAFAVGYASEAAFSTAFRRVMGCAPRRYGAFVRQSWSSS